MNNPFEIIPWAIAIGFGWIMLTSVTGLDDFLKKLFGRNEKTAAFEARIGALEKRVAQLEGGNSEASSVNSTKETA